jgi:hypothetical protein
VKRVLLVATTTGYQIRSFGDAAAALGVRLLFASDRCDQLDDPWWDRAIAVRFHDEPAATAAVLDACAGEAPDAVIAVGDRPTILAAHLNAAFGLPGNPPEAASASRDKRRARAAFGAASLPTPRFRDCSIADDPATLAGWIDYPSVIKPVALSGSRGVMRVDDPRQFVAAFERLRMLLQSADVRLERDPAHDRVLVEDFIPGREYAVEGVLTRGAFHPLAIFDKPDPLDGPFFEETLYVTPSRQPQRTQDRIVESVRRRRRGRPRTRARAHPRRMPRQRCWRVSARNRRASNRRTVLAGVAIHAAAFNSQLRMPNSQPSWWNAGRLDVARIGFSGVGSWELAVDLAGGAADAARARRRHLGFPA